MKSSKKFAFAVGDLFGGGSVNIVNFLYPGFLALVIGLNPYLCGVIMLVARIFDAVTDPVMGIITDRTKSKMGKRRIWLAVAAPFILISFVLLFMPVSFDSVALRFTFVLVSYVFFSAVQTMTVIPYQALSSEIASDYKVRAGVNALRRFFNVLASIIAVGVPPIIVRAFADKTVMGFDGTFGYVLMSVIFGVLFAVAILITALFAKEEIVTPPYKGKLSVCEFIAPLRVKSFRYFLGMSISCQMLIAVLTGVFFFFCNFYLFRDIMAKEGTVGFSTLAAVLMFLMQLVAIPIYLKIANKINKATVFRLGALITIIGCLLIFLLQPNGSPIFVFIVAAILGFGISGIAVAPIMMFGDVADVVLLKSDGRKEGVMSGLMNLFNKTAQAVGVALMMFILGLSGFISAEPGELVLTQPLGAQTAMLYIFTLSPIVIISFGIFFSYKYKIDAKKHAEIIERIGEK